MNTYTLKRLQSGPMGTFGELCFGDDVLCKTCELPWNNNLPRKSCIPPGVYPVIPHTGPVWQDVWEIIVPGRTAILIHAANLPEQVEGCVAVGSVFGDIDGKPAVLGSRAALDKLRKILPNKFTLIVK